ncbi:MAG: 2OG-Fe(II) oxygenase [Alphaproteobacteria bacterium]|nr:MAG: 2OG-Fe(II) oxygenase [Alphaproteobacteria bacterium]
MAYLNEAHGDTGLLPAFELRDRGLELHEQYRNALPFPHIVIDDFMPASVLAGVLEHFPDEASNAGAFERAQERLKFQYGPDTLHPSLRMVFYAFNSLPFIRVLENITGIKGLVPDPYYFGGGLHELRQGGHLSIHADFNHHKPMGLERRINVLIYLNQDWRDDYGGQLELWDKGMSQCVRSILPSFNRCVIFNTTGKSYHGNPHPISHPLGVSRKSIALYYYTATWSQGDREYTTQFQKRPDSDDRSDWMVRSGELVAELLPPVLYRAVRAAKRGISRIRGRA